MLPRGLLLRGRGRQRPSGILYSATLLVVVLVLVAVLVVCFLSFINVVVVLSLSLSLFFYCYCWLCFFFVVCLVAAVSAGEQFMNIGDTFFYDFQNIIIACAGDSRKCYQYPGL